MIVSKRLVEDDENVLARKVFVTLVKLYPRGYSILNDGYFVKKIYAASDDEAIRQFNELATKGKLLTENISNRIDSDSDSTLKEERKIITIKKEVERKWYISNANDGRYISDEYGIVFDFDFDKAKSFDTKERAVSAIDYMKNSREWKYFNPKPKFRIFHVDTDISSSEDTVNESIVNNNKSIQSKNVKKQVVEAKHETLVESVMSDLDLEVKEAGGKEAWIANVDEQIDDLSHYLNYLKKSAYNEVNRGGNFESTDEVDEAIRDCEKQLGLLKSKKQIIKERKDESVNKDNHVDEALHIYPSLAIDEFETFKRLCDKIGLKTLADVERFMKENGKGKDVITALKDYLINELGIDFQAKNESLKENLDLDNIEFDNPGQTVRAGLDAVYKLIKSPSNASIRFFISSMAAKYKMTDLELDYLEDFISNVLEGMNEHSMAMKYRNGKLPIRYAENLTDADKAYVERMLDECKTASDLQDLLFEAINNLSLELGESLKEDLAVNGEEVPVDAEKQPIEEIQEKISIEQVLSDLIKDEFEAIDGYSSSLATLKILENDGSDYSGIIANLEDIKNEELVHVGQLQKCLAEVNPKAEAIDDGKEEASETIAVAEEESAKGEEPVVEA